MILGGQSQPVRGTLFIAANATIFYPVASTHLNAVSGFTKSGGPDYELSGSKRGIWKNKTVGGIITSFDHGTNGPYVLSEKEDWTICYVNQNGFDKFTFLSNGDGTYRYKHRWKGWGGGSGTHSEGTCSPAGG